MKKLIDGIGRFQKDGFESRRGLFEQLAHGQQPETMMIVCSDSRVDPNLLTQAEPGELFVLRNAGNIVPPYDGTGEGGAATVEYAVVVLKVAHLIVCGHSQCGAVNGALHPEQLDGLTAVPPWLVYAETCVEQAKSQCGESADEKSLLTTAIEQNVLAQLENLRTHPYVAKAEGEGKLTLHSWVYEFETGTVRAYDSDSQQFTPIDPSQEAV